MYRTTSILCQLKPPNRTANIHKAKVTELTSRPAFDHVDLSLNIAARENANITGGANTIMIPARDPRREPQPKPGILSICNTTKNHGDNANQKLIFPIVVGCILLFSILTMFESSLSYSMKISTKSKDLSFSVIRKIWLTLVSSVSSAHVRIHYLVSATCLKCRNTSFNSCLTALSGSLITNS